MVVTPASTHPDARLLSALGNAIAEREALRLEIVQPRGKDGKFRARERADG